MVLPQRPFLRPGPSGAEFFSLKALYGYRNGAVATGSALLVVTSVVAVSIRQRRGTITPCSIL